MRFAYRLAITLSLAAGIAASAQTAPDPTIVRDDLPATFTPPASTETPDYTRRVVMMPMRDGVKLYTVIWTPRGAHDAPIVLTRTPYNAAAHMRSTSPRMIEALALGDEGFVRSGFIRVYQDVRGKYGSEGPYLMTPPPVGPFNPTGADDTTDAYDTIDWLVKNVHESNGRVGMIGSSYEGFTVVMALLHPHPALKVAAPESPMIDGWMGDDWFHYGAFRQPNYDYILGQTAARGAGPRVPHPDHDDYAGFLAAGSGAAWAKAQGLDQLPYWKTIEAHPAYDAFWQSQALDHLIAKMPLTVPTMWEQGEWDQEDMWGGIHSFRAWEPKDKNNNMNFLVMGPWFHSQINREGRGLGPFQWHEDTTDYWRNEVMLPFFMQHLKPGSPKADTPPALLYDAGRDRWDRYASFPQACEQGCPGKSRSLFLAANGALTFTAPGAVREGTATPESADPGFDAFVSDPAHPVPYRPRPIRAEDGGGWRTWLVADQRFVEGRPDVLVYQTAPLSEPMKLAGEPVVHLSASTTGTDADWVVKIIDVFPDRPVAQRDTAGIYPGVVGTPVDMSGYELPLATDIFRGRYRTSFEKPQALTPDTPATFTFAMPMINYTLQPGHRLMVQVQSTLFPLYDRNPQTFVPNIFQAQPTDYKSATHKIWRTDTNSSFITLPVVAAP